MSFRNAAILTLAVLLVGGAVIFWSQSPSAQSNYTTVATMPTRAVQLSDLSSASLIYRDATVMTLNQQTKKTTPLLTEDVTQHIAFFSPTGQYAVALPSGKVRLVNVSTGATVREFSWEQDRILQAVAWSPNEQTVLLSSDRQHADGGPIANSNRIDLWTVNVRRQVQIGVQPANELPWSLLAVNNDGSQLLCGWTDERGIIVKHCFTDKQPVQINATEFQRQPDQASTSSDISAISNDTSLISSNGIVYEYTLSSGNIRALGKTAHSQVQLSSLTSDGRSALVVLGGQGATDMVRQYSFTDGSLKTLLPVFTDAEGFYQSHWLPGNRYLLYETPESEFRAVDMQDTTGTLLLVTMPVSDGGWEYVGMR